MVWFQCEDCGDNLKKPKLANHFRSCSANKLSCIDCGQVFGQQSVQEHTQCITETEKYGPKGLNKPSNGTPGKPGSASKPKPEVDINVGLSERPPWFCSLCNTSATSKQTLLSHADGKKHRAKARAFHASKQPPKESEEPTPKQPPKESEEPTPKQPPKESEEHTPKQPPKESEEPITNTEAKSENVQKNDLPAKKDGKKRKLEVSKTNDESGNGEVIQEIKKAKQNKKGNLKKIRWKKIITKVLKSSPDGVMKMRKLRTQVLKTLKESGSTIDENLLADTLEQKINLGLTFVVDGKYVKFAKS